MKKRCRNVAKRRKKTSDALEIIYNRYYRGKPEREAEYAEMEANVAIAVKIRDLREKAGLSQRALAKLVGTTASAICRLEDADYEGHSLAMLNRIAAALDKRVEIRFVSNK
jgi:DNA-binding XRE family transcriptional regulator